MPYIFRRHAVMALLLAMAILIGGCSAPRPEEVAVSFIQAVADGKYDRAIAMADIPEKLRQDKQRWENDQGKLTAMLSHAREQFDKKGGVSSIEVAESIYEKPDRQGRERMRVRLRISTGNGKTSSEDVSLVLDGKQWRIDVLGRN